MKILWLTEFFPATGIGEITGGVEARCFFVSKYLRESGHKVQIISRPAGQWETASWASVPGRLKYLAKTFFCGVREDFDLVEGTNFITHPVAWLLGMLKNKPVIFWYADVYIGHWVKISGTVGYLMEIFERLMIRLPGVNFIAISEATKTKLIAAGVKPDRIRVIYCGYDDAEIVKIKVKDIKYDLVSVSRLMPYKRISDLALAVRELHLKAAVIGQGPEKEKLENTPGLDLLGYIPEHRKVLEIVKSGKIFCHPSVIEGFGIVVIEAMALGVPVVAGDIPVMVEITRGGQGALFFKAGDANDLTQKLRQLLSNQSLYKQKAAEAKLLAKNYLWKNIARETEAVYEDLLSH